MRTPAGLRSGGAWRPDWPLDLRRTLFPHQRSAGDPALRYVDDDCWRTVSTPDGPATVHLTVRGGEVRVSAWGPGAERAGAAVPGWLGAEDRPEEFEPGGHPLLAGPLQEHGAIGSQRHDHRSYAGGEKGGRTSEGLGFASVEEHDLYQRP